MCLHFAEYVNGQRAIWFHPSGYLVSQHDGAWHFEQPSPHSQPAKVQLVFSLYTPQVHTVVTWERQTANVVGLISSSSSLAVH